MRLCRELTHIDGLLLSFFFLRQVSPESGGHHFGGTP